MTSGESKTFPVVNPSNGVTITDVADMGVSETFVAINAAHEAFQIWKHKSAKV